MPKTNINDHICTIWLLFKIVTVAGKMIKEITKSTEIENHLTYIRIRIPIL